MKANLNTESTRVNVAIFYPRIAIIQQVVANHYGLTLDETKEHKRRMSSIKARQRVHYFCKELLCKEGMKHKCPLSVVGLLTGNGEAFDHSTIIHGHRKVYKELTFKNRSGELVYPEVLAEITQMRDKIMDGFEDLRKTQAEQAEKEKERLKNEAEAARAEPTVKRCPQCGNIIH